MPPRNRTTHPEIDAFIERHAAAGDWPGAAYAIGAPGDLEFHGAAGCLALEPRAEPARKDALYDLASLTKALVTAPLAILVARSGGPAPEEPLDRLLPELRGYAGRTPSFADLLAHRAGLPAWAPLPRLASGREEVPSAIAALTPAARHGERPVYSCLGPILAAIALERQTGSRLDALFREAVARPLGIGGDALRFGPLPRALIARAAPTERGRAYERSLAAGRPGEVEPLDEAPLRGEVHDGNAAFLGGVAGNAGLFGTAEAVFTLASALAAPGRLFDDRELRWFRTVLAEGQGDARTFGFRSGRAEAAPAGAFGPRSYGHVGFTGTSVWIDPERPRLAVLLTNRIHPRWKEAPIQQWRREFHDLAAAGTPA